MSKILVLCLYIWSDIECVITLEIIYQIILKWSYKVFDQ